MAPMSHLSFDHRMPCALDRASLWHLLEAALRDTDAATFWPNQLNRVIVPAMEVGTPFHATYRCGPFPETRSPYVVADVVPEQRFSYSPGPTHPFRGRINVDIEDAAAGSILRWHGAYTMAAWRPERAFFRWYLEPRFFPALRAGLASIRPTRAPIV